MAAKTLSILAKKDKSLRNTIKERLKFISKDKAKKIREYVELEVASMENQERARTGKAFALQTKDNFTWIIGFLAILSIILLTFYRKKN